MVRTDFRFVDWDMVAETIFLALDQALVDVFTDIQTALCIEDGDIHPMDGFGIDEKIREVSQKSMNVLLRQSEYQTLKNEWVNDWDWMESIKNNKEGK